MLALASTVILGSESSGTHDHILLSQIWDSPILDGQVRVIYIPQEQRGPVIAPGSGFPFRRLLRFAGLRWRYSNPPPQWHSRLPLTGELYITSYCKERHQHSYVSYWFMCAALYSADTSLIKRRMGRAVLPREGICHSVVIYKADFSIWRPSSRKQHITHR
jgi:hypothetical protein